MKRKLFANMKRLTTLFCICIGVITVLMLVLRLTLLRGMVAEPDATPVSISTNFIDYSFNDSIYLASTTSTASLQIQSSSTNTSDMQVRLLSEDTGELLYETMLLPGHSVKKAALLHELDTGAWECILEISALYPESGALLDKKEHYVIVYVGVRPDEVSLQR